MTERPIAIVGSGDATRTDYEPSLRNVGIVPEAAEAIGRELAFAGYRILVFASAPDFIENHVVRGYVASGKAQRGSIEVRYPLVRKPEIHGAFPEEEEHGELFHHIRDTHPQWEVSYYLSVSDVGGIVMVGGGNATLLIGLMALSNELPLVAVATFGGQAGVIWALLRESPLIDASQHQAMDQAWSDDLAPRLVASLGVQEKRKTRLEEKTRRRAERRCLLALGSMVLAVVLTAYGTFSGTRSPLLFAICFFGVPIAAGVSGALTRSLLDYLRGATLEPGQSIWVTPVLGMGRGRRGNPLKTGRGRRGNPLKTREPRSDGPERPERSGAQPWRAELPGMLRRLLADALLIVHPPRHHEEEV